MIKPRVILIRENAETLTCSSCAGTLEGIDAFGTRAVADYAPTREIMGQVGELYRALRREFGDAVEIEVVDPRNAVYLIPALFADYRRFHPRLSDFLRALFFGASPASVIVNGRALHVGELPAPQGLVQEVRQALEEAGALRATEAPGRVRAS